MLQRKALIFYRDHAEVFNSVDLVPEREPITIVADDGESTPVTLHDGSKMIVRKLSENSHDVTNPQDAIAVIDQAKANNEIATGLLYMDPNEFDLHDILNTVNKPLNELERNDLVPTQSQLDEVNNSLS